MTPGGKRGTNDPGGAISYMVDVSRLPDTGVVVRIDASERELEALATEHGLKAVKRFTPNFG